jgi:hypothetical protein
VQWKTTTAVYCRLSKSHKDSEEGNEKFGVEDWRNLILRSVITFSDFVNAVETTLAVATIIIE